MISLFIAFCVSFVLCFLLTPMARALAIRYGLIDRPDGERKLHKRPTPTAGGIVVLVSSCAGVLSLLLFSSPMAAPILHQGPNLCRFLLGAAVVCGLGIADDYWRLRGRQKLIGQLVAISIVLSSGLEVTHVRLGTWSIALGPFSVPLTVLWLLGAINALNLLDGMDGLLSSVGLIMAAGMGAMAVVNHQWVPACIALALAGALLGFLNYNLPPATIFLGDTGSTLIGLVIGVLAIRCSFKAPATLALATPLAVLTIPILDTAAAIIRRKLTGRSIYSTDREHLHHCLLRKGFTSRRVLVWVASLCLLSVGGALLSLLLYNDLLAMLVSLMVIGILIGTRLFGYNEWLLVKSRCAATALWLLPRNRVRPAHDRGSGGF
jgi:UDP-GlcNAc:undecaprenyl-phosphate/decaprenyl-phosphate GlcNAc-1-phosphate transferase